MHLFTDIALVLLFAYVYCNASKGTTWTLSIVKNIIVETRYHARHVDVRNHFRCAGLCQRDSDCRSFFYHENKTCLLQSKVYNVGEMHALGTKRPGTVYYIPDAKKTPKGCLPGQSVAGMDKKHFILNNLTQSWRIAKTLCESEGGDLATMHTDSDRLILKNFAENSISGNGPVSVWLNGWFSHAGQTFVWYDNQKMIETDSSLWHNSNEPMLLKSPGEFTQANRTECLMAVTRVHNYPEFMFKLDDTQCEGNTPYFPLCVCSS